jgi:hypothetical protein
MHRLTQDLRHLIAGADQCAQWGGAVTAYIRPFQENGLLSAKQVIKKW